MPNRRILAYFLMALASFFGVEAKTFTVVLDPGHGGKDYGAVGAITNEKTINLDVALEVRRLLADSKDIKVIMTRSDDRFIALQERAAIANRNHGDLFVSIHVNSVAMSNKNRKSVQGASVYALGLHRSESNLEVAKRENSVMELESDYSTRYQGFDPNSAESYIIFELSQNKHLDHSIRFADMAQRQLVTTAGRADRGVLQAGFWVLHASAMPAVLVELDFICNPTVERYLNSAKGKQEMALAIATAIANYAGSKVPAVPSVAKSAVAEPEAEVAPALSESDDNQNVITYRVQFMASDKKLPTASFKGLQNIDSYRHGGMIKYTSGGDFKTEADAENYAQRIRSKFPQAFVIRWLNGTRLE